MRFTKKFTERIPYYQSKAPCDDHPSPKDLAATGKGLAAGDPMSAGEDMTKADWRRVQKAAAKIMANDPARDVSLEADPHMKPFLDLLNRNAAALGPALVDAAKSFAAAARDAISKAKPKMESFTPPHEFDFTEPGSFARRYR